MIYFLVGLVCFGLGLVLGLLLFSASLAFAEQKAIINGRAKLCGKEYKIEEIK